MKITGPLRTQEPARVKNKKSTTADRFNLPEEEAAPAQGPSAPSHNIPITNVEALLSAQSVDVYGEEKSAGLKRGQEMLDALEEVRKGILLGAIPVQKLRNIINAIDQNRHNYVDPKLQQIIEDIELRGRVELAKLGIFL